MMSSMFHLPLPIAEKILRPVIVYIVLIGFLRLFGKRELAQLNPFDLVVLLSLANTVQNAIIGDDNSVTGGVIGAFALLAVNWLLMRLLFHMPKLNAALEGSATVLVNDGVIDQAAMVRETLTRPELLSALHKEGVDALSEVRRCTLEPSGTFHIERAVPGPDDVARKSIHEALEALTLEVRELRERLAGAQG